MRPTQSPVHCAWVNYSYQWYPAKQFKEKRETFTLSDQPSEMCDFLIPLQVNMNVLVVLPPSAEVPLICSFSSIKGVFGHATVTQHRCMNVPTLPWMTHRCTHLTIHPKGLFLFPFFFPSWSITILQKPLENVSRNKTSKITFLRIYIYKYIVGSGMMIQMLNKLLPLKERLLVCSDSLFLQANLQYITLHHIWFPQQKPYWIIGL